jgi:hypothetical protein
MFDRALAHHSETGTMAVKIRLGDHVDRYLQSHEAIAQAVENNTILLSSTVLAMHPDDLTLILCHELAHLEQLARCGNDPEGALEAEAWEAAWAWAAGKDYRIRGRGRHRLSALAIIQGGPKGHPHAPLWYRTSPVEPIGGSSVITVKDVQILDRMTLEAILDVIVANQGTSEVLIVSHGTGGGLAIPVRQGARSGADAIVVRTLAANRSREDVGWDGTKTKAPIISDEAAAEIAILHEDQVRQLRAKMNQVQNMKLKHVAFRACNMGVEKATMHVFREFFGATSVSAPILLDSYGKFAPEIHGSLEAWAKKKKKDGYHISIDEGVAYGINRAPHSIEYLIRASAASKDVFKKWVAKHIAEGAWGSGGVIYHAMVVSHAAPTEPIIYFVRDVEFISQIVNLKG